MLAGLVFWVVRAKCRRKDSVLINVMANRGAFAPLKRDGAYAVAGDTRAGRQTIGPALARGTATSGPNV